MARTLPYSLVQGASCTSREEGSWGTSLFHHRGVMSLKILMLYTVELRTVSLKGSHMRIFSLIGVAYLLAGACASALAQVPIGTWSTAAPLPQPHAEHTVIALDGKIYAIAGGIPQVDGMGMQNNGASTLVED